jgi:hypothetical protein
MVTFDLRIHFVGLMMWVPDPAGAMHVLMPSTEGHVHGGGGEGGGAAGGGVHAHQHHVSGHPAPRSAASDARLARAVNEITAALEETRHGARTLTPVAATEALAALSATAAATEGTPQHFVRLAYDLAYQIPSSTQLMRVWQMVDLTNRVLNLTGLQSSGGFVSDLPDELASLDTMANPVDRALVTRLPASLSSVAARVTMSSGVLSDYEVGAPFTFESPDVPQRITPVTEWNIRGIPLPEDGSNPLQNLVIQGPEEGQETRLPPLHPIGQTIHLTLYHMVSKEFPPHNLRFRPEAENDDDHFEAYFQVATPKKATPPPRKLAGLEIPVLGARVNEKDKQNPGSICGQAKASLA